jgi:hypothetical protein
MFEETNRQGAPLHHLPPSQTDDEAPATLDGRDHQAIQLEQLRRLAELGMELAESAARLAKRNMAEPPPDPEPVTAEEAGTEHLYYPCPTDLPPTPPRNPEALFNQFARTVQNCINLQNRLIAEHAKAARPIADPRRVTLRRVLRPLIHTVPADSSHPARPTHYTIDQAVDRELKSDPDRATPLSEILTLVCEEIGLNPAIFDNEIHLPPFSQSSLPPPDAKPPPP